MEYDHQIRQVIPFYDEALATLLDVAFATCPETQHILELGLGTGNLAGLLLSRFPQAHLTGIDLIQDFLEFDELRMKSMRAHGVSEERITREYIEHRQLEMPVDVTRQLDWLHDTGFVDTECFWKYLNLAMFGGRKPTASQIQPRICPSTSSTTLGA